MSGEKQSRRAFLKKALMIGGTIGVAALVISTTSCDAESDNTFTVDQSKCTGCGECKKVCPANAITLSTTASINSKKCIGCGHCARVCPENAISIA